MKRATKQSYNNRNNQPIKDKFNDIDELLPENKLLYRNNMKALKECYPELVETIFATADNGEFEWIRTGPKGLPNLYLTDSKQYYYELGNPIEDACKQVQALQLKNARLGIFLGLGLGYELVYFLDELADNQYTKFIVVIEKDINIFRAALRSINMVSIIKNPKIKFIVGIPEDDLFMIFQPYLMEKNRYLMVKGLKAIYHPSALKINKSYYIKCLQIIRDAATQQVIYYGNCPWDSLWGVENMLANLNEIVSNPGINLLFDKFSHKPAIVVATGPSLNKNKHLLKELEDKAVLIAADASLRVMMEMGVKPHLVASLERTMTVKKLVEGFSPEEVADVYYAACPVIQPEVFAAYTGPRIIVYRNFEHFRWLGIDKGILEIKMSAGNMAFKLAAALGCDPIILIGQDLAFSREGETHAQGTPGAENGKQESLYNGFPRVTVMGNDGMPIDTIEGWYQCIKGYEMDLEEYPGTCINSTEGGAYIPGTVVMPFQQAIDLYIKEDFNPRQVIQEILSTFSITESKNDIWKVINIIDETIEDMKYIRQCCEKGVELCEHYGDELEEYLRYPQTLEGKRDRLLHLDRQILMPKYKCSLREKTFQQFFAHIFQSFVIKFELDMNALGDKYDQVEQTMCEVLLRHKEWYAVIGDLASISMVSLEKARENIMKI